MRSRWNARCWKVKDGPHILIGNTVISIRSNIKRIWNWKIFLELDFLDPACNMRRDALQTKILPCRPLGTISLQGIQGIFFNTKFPLQQQKGELCIILIIQGVIDQASLWRIWNHNRYGNLYGAIVDLMTTTATDFNQPENAPARMTPHTAGLTIKFEKYLWTLVFKADSNRRLSILKERRKWCGNWTQDDGRRCFYYCS